MFDAVSIPYLLCLKRPLNIENTDLVRKSDNEVNLYFDKTII